MGARAGFVPQPGGSSNAATSHSHAPSIWSSGSGVERSRHAASSSHEATHGNSRLNLPGLDASGGADRDRKRHSLTSASRESVLQAGSTAASERRRGSEVTRSVWDGVIPDMPPLEQQTTSSVPAVSGGTPQATVKPVSPTLETTNAPAVGSITIITPDQSSFPVPNRPEPFVLRRRVSADAPGYALTDASDGASPDYDRDRLSTRSADELQADYGQDDANLMGGGAADLISAANNGAQLSAAQGSLPALRTTQSPLRGAAGGADPAAFSSQPGGLDGTRGSTRKAHKHRRRRSQRRDVQPSEELHPMGSAPA